MKRELITLRNGEKMSKDKVSRAYRLYDYLKENAVGDKNKKSAIQIIYSLNDCFKSRQDVEEAIQVLRISEDRKIGSSTNGYWLMTSQDAKDGYQYIINQAVSKMKVAIMSGVAPELFYKVIAEIKDKCNSTIDGQQTITFSDYEKTEVRRLSDDLITQ